MLAFPGPEVFEAVLDRIETGLYVVDGKQRVVYWNHGAEKITGLLTQEMLGRPCAGNLGLETLEHNPAMCVHQCQMERAAREPCHDVMVSMRHRAGHVLRVRLWTMAVRNGAGEIVGAVKVFTDRANAPEVSVEKTGGLLEDLHVESRLPGEPRPRPSCKAKSISVRKRR